MTAPTALATTLATELNGRVVDHFGDQRVLVRGDIIYANPLGQIKVDHRGRITTLGGCSDSPETLAAAYRSTVAGVRR